MRFRLVDRIVEMTRGERIVTVKAVSLAEEYLADHFPTFPVLPGVLMLQVMVESASWLVRDALAFAPTIILLRQAKNVTYRSFVKPGQLLRIEVRCRRLEPGDSDFEGAGSCNEAETLKARFRLAHSCLSDRWPDWRTTDERIRANARAAFAALVAAARPVPTDSDAS